jgi:hypothetical protein
VAVTIEVWVSGMSMMTKVAGNVSLGSRWLLLGRVSLLGFI